MACLQSWLAEARRPVPLLSVAAIKGRFAPARRTSVTALPVSVESLAIGQRTVVCSNMGSRRERWGLPLTGRSERTRVRVNLDALFPPGTAPGTAGGGDGLVLQGWTVGAGPSPIL
jgi:hypothetical protein